MKTLFDIPVKTDVESRIMDYLLRGNSLTTLECQRLFSTTELRHYISEIRKRGYNVVSDRIKVVCADGHRATINRYRITSIL